MGSALVAANKKRREKGEITEIDLKHLYYIERKMPSKNIYYSDKYTDEKFEYRHVMLPKDLAKQVPKSHLMSETEWRSLGVQQSQGWIHYMTHDPEPHILLFRRPLSIYGDQNVAAN